MIIIDGSTWNVPCDITRVAEVRSSNISGMMLDKSYFNDVIGTYLKYDVLLAVPTTMQDTYANIYETLTAPADAHSFVMPYNQGTIQITAMVAEVRDVFVYSASQRQYWKGVKFTATATHPTKTMQLDEVLTRGKSPLPEVVGLPVGSVYELKSTGWEEYSAPSYEDVDEVSF